MALSNRDVTTIREYLLGQLTEEEQHKVEERLVVEDDLFEEFEISKGELVEDYCAGELNQYERDWLEKHYLASPEGKQKHKFTVALNSLRLSIPEPALASVPQSPSVATMRSWRTLALVSTFALALIAVAILIIRQGQPTHSTTIELLISSPARDEDGPTQKSVRVAELDQVRISLLLPDSTPPATSYRAELYDRIKTKPIKISGFDSRAVTVEIRTSELKPGRYAVILLAITADGQEQRLQGYYFFDVE